LRGLSNLVDNQKDEAFVSKISDGDATCVRERMSHRQPDTIGRDFHRLDMERGSVFLRTRDNDGHVELAIDEEVFEMIAPFFDDFHINRRK
jgi:hypothetical protein